MTEDNVSCPSCAESIQPHAILCRFCQQGISPNHFRACRHCAEMVRKEAIICRYCGANMKIPAAADAKGGRPSMVKSAEIIESLLGQLRLDPSVATLLEFAVYAMARGFDSDRCLILQIVGDELVVTNEYVQKGGQPCFVGTNFGPKESGAIVIDFLSRFPDQSGEGALFISDAGQDSTLRTVAPTLSSLIELGEVRSMIVAQLTYRQVCSGFVALLQNDSVPSLNRYDFSTLENLAVLLSCVIQLSLPKT